MALDFDTLRSAFAMVDADEELLRRAAILAMGLLAGGGHPAAHAAIVRLYQRTWPDALLPDLVQEMLAHTEARH